MITFHNILTEAHHGVTDDISAKAPVDAIVELIKTNCTEFYKNWQKHQPIYRGMKKGRTPALVVDPSTYTRKGTSGRKGIGLHNLVISLSPEWKDYPSRLSCIIGSFSRREASGFGTVYRVIPFDGAVFGICPESDLWNTTLAIVLESLRKYRAKPKTFPSDTTWSELLAHFPPDAAKRIASLAPKSTDKFMVVPYAKLQRGHLAEEVWTNSKCLLVREDLFETKVAAALDGKSTPYQSLP